MAKKIYQPTPTEFPHPNRPPELLPNKDPLEPNLPEFDPDFIPDEEPDESPPFEIPIPGEGP